MGASWTLGVAMVPFCRLLNALNEIPDPRRAEGKRYPLAPLLLFTVLALLSGATSYRRIIIFLDQRRVVLNTLFGVSLKRAPSINTVRTVLQDLDGDALEQAFRRHAEGLLPATEPGRMPVIALDGKTLKGSFDHLNDRKAAQSLSAFASEAAILLAHSEIDVKSNELPAAQRMIAELNLSGVLFTADALHCQKKHLRPPATAATPCSSRSRPTSRPCWPRSRTSPHPSLRSRASGASIPRATAAMRPARSRPSTSGTGSMPSGTA
jgi:predicted transposase YbfD/YdcC